MTTIDRWTTQGVDGHAIAVQVHETIRAHRARTRRILIALVAMSAMGLFDLAFTLLFLTTTGMHEVNPIARWLIQNGTSTHLIVYKLATIAVSSAAIFAARRRPVAEHAAWLCFGILSILMAHWVNYVYSMEEIGSDLVLVMEQRDSVGGAWLTLDR